MHRIIARAKEELRAVAPPAVFFFLTFHILAWPHFWAVQMWLLLLLFVYCALRELIRALGREQVISMFFGTSRRTTAG